MLCISINRPCGRGMKGVFHMPYSYKPLWHLLAEHDMTKTQFREAVGLSTSTLAKLSANQPVSSEVLAKICDYFGCGLDSVVVYVSQIEHFMLGIESEINGWHYSVRINEWPEYRFDLTPQQANFICHLDQGTVNRVVLQAELAANEEFPLNAGIIDSTKFYLRGTTLFIKGSLAVVKRLLPWIIENAKLGL